VRVLVTNDDGIDSPGLHELARAMAGAGHEVVVAASLDDRTGSGAAVGPAPMTEGIPLERREVPGLPGVPAFGVDAPPALIVLVSRLGAFGDPPELVVSGINPGPNTGRALMHSGTVGAALTAGNLGLSALAVSQGLGDPVLWPTAGRLAQLAVEWLVTAPARTIVNLNVPNRPLAELAGVRWATLAPFGTVRTAVTGAEEGRLQVEFRATEEELDPASDTALVAAGYATLTTIVGVRATAEDPGLVRFVTDHLP
jgi:5'-nucleotidase